jgi:hypothetical protein
VALPEIYFVGSRGFSFWNIKKVKKVCSLELRNHRVHTRACGGRGDFSPISALGSHIGSVCVW